MKRRQRTTVGRDLLGFEVGAVAYAIDVDRAREIVKLLPIVPLPHMPDSVLGVADHRGDVVPVLDLRRQFQVTPSERAKDHRFVLVAGAGGLVALAVDRVTEVFGSQEAEARDLAALADTGRTRGVKAAYAHRGRLVFKLDVDALTQEVADLARQTGPREGAERGR